MALEITDATFEETVLNSDKPVMVDFWAAWCGPCRMVGPIIDEISNEYDGKAVVGFLPGAIGGVKVHLGAAGFPIGIDAVSICVAF